MNTITKPRSIVPAFFVIEAPADEAEDRAADWCEGFNKVAAYDWQTARRLPFARLRLCEASPTTEEESEGEAPATLEGYTCDSGSDRSAAGLIRTIAEACEACPLPDGSAAIATITHIGQVAQGWIRQRMALGHIEPKPVDPAEKQDAVELLFHAYAAAEAYGRVPLNFRDALDQAKAERPGVYEAILALYQQRAAEAAQAVERG